MKCSAIKKFWGGLFHKPEKETRSPSQPSSIGFYPLTVGLRVDMSIPSGEGKETRASQLIWVSPAGTSRSVKSLRVLLLPN